MFFIDLTESQAKVFKSLVANKLFVELSLTLLKHFSEVNQSIISKIVQAFKPLFKQ